MSLDYQNNDVEFANPPGMYASPKECVLLADRQGEIEGCVAMRQVTPEICEMKRLYVPRRGDDISVVLLLNA